MRLLIIDDEAHIRQLMRLTLETAGYDVEEAATGEEGLARFGTGEQHAAVLLDQKMPGIDGLHTLVKMLERAPETRVIMVTAFASVELAVDAMKLGATDFLRKPMTPETLRAAVAGALQRSAAPARRPATVPSGGMPIVEWLTVNGYRLSGRDISSGPGGTVHTFEIVHYPDHTPSTVSVTIDPEAVDRVARLTKRRLEPTGGFWRSQAQRLLSAYLWTEGHPPADGRLSIRDVSRNDLDIAAAWESD